MPTMSPSQWQNAVSAAHTREQTQELQERKAGRTSSISTTRTTLTSQKYIGVNRLEMNSYERQVFETLRQLMKNSPNLNVTQKEVIERLLNDIERIAKNDGGVYM